MAEETETNLESTETENQVESTETENQEEQKVQETKSEEHINQEAVNKRIDKLVFEKHEERKKREELEAKYQAEIEKRKELEKPKDITIPSMPDAYDPEYAAKLQERDRLIQEKGRLDAAAEATRKAEQDRVEQQRAEQDKLFRQQTDTMYSVAEKAGITKDEILKAEQTVSLFVTDPSLVRYVLAHEDSAFIVNHLANNVQELEKVGKMSPVNASAYIATKILPEAKEYKPKASSAPDPLSIPSGGPGGPEDPYLKGVTFS